jgi:hypothetical protein
MTTTMGDTGVVEQKQHEAVVVVVTPADEVNEDDVFTPGNNLHPQLHRELQQQGEDAVVVGGGEAAAAAVGAVNVVQHQQQQVGLGGNANRHRLTPTSPPPHHPDQQERDHQQEQLSPWRKFSSRSLKLIERGGSVLLSSPQKHSTEEHEGVEMERQQRRRHQQQQLTRRRSSLAPIPIWTSHQQQDAPLSLSEASGGIGRRRLSLMTSSRQETSAGNDDDEDEEGLPETEVEAPQPPLSPLPTELPLLAELTQAGLGDEVRVVTYDGNNEYNEFSKIIFI